MRCYCPLITQVRQWSDRKKKVGVPAICFFVQLPDSERFGFSSQLVLCVICTSLGKPTIVRDEEISIIKSGWIHLK
jgi:hypothetical protein